MQATNDDESRRPAPLGHAPDLPVQLTSFVGRERVLEEVEALLTSTRLLTLTGVGGVGKTRLATEVAARQWSHFVDGVSFVALAAIRDPGLVVLAIAQALGMPETGGRPPIERLGEMLRERRHLLVLDNFEQVVAAAPALGTLLLSCPNLKIMVTSRERLRLAGEQVYQVPPFALPASPDSIPVGGDVPAAWRESEAVRLFVERARGVSPSFALTPDNAPAVAEICRRLDGVPLAIELAAARVGLLSPRALQEHLEPRLRLLTGGPRDAPPRQRTLRDTLAWSHELLNEPERRLFRRLSVFVGGCTLEAASAVCDASDEGEMDVLAIVASLVDKSLLQSDASADGPRFAMLEIVHEYAREQLEACGETEAIRARHIDYFIAEADRAHDGIWSANQVAWLDWVHENLDNIRAVLDWSTGTSGDPEVGLVLMRGTCRFWDMRGFFAEGRARTAALLARVDGLPGPRSSDLVAEGEVYTRLLAGFLAFAQGDLAEATAHATRAMMLAQRIGFVFGEATGLFGLASIAQVAGNLTKADALLDQALALARETGDARSLYHTLYWRGEGARVVGDYDRADAILEECLDVTRRYGNPWQEAGILFSLGHVALMRDNLGRARDRLAESLEMRRTQRDSFGVALNVDALGWVAAASKQWERAAQLFGAANGLRDRIGAGVETGWSSERQRFMEQARLALGEPRFAACWADGQALTQEDAVDLALTVQHAPTRAPDDSRTDGTNGALTIFTPRERDTIRLITQGLSNREIAATLMINERTAANYVQRVLDKLDLHTRGQVAAWAVRHGLGPVSDE